MKAWLWPLADRSTLRTPEFRLACACAMWPPSDVRVAAVRAAVADGHCDWAKFVRIVRRHRMVGLAADGLRRAGLPPLSKLETLAINEKRRALALAAETIRVDRLLRTAAVDVRTFKGTPLAQEAYGDLGLRHSRDIDLLVPVDQVEKTWGILTAAGYERTWPSAKLTGSRLRKFLWVSRDSNLHHREKRIEIELHWRLTDLMRDSAAGPGLKTRDVLVGGAEIRTLDHDFLFVYLCVHGCQSGWMRLKWLSDIAAFLNTAKDGGLAYWREAERTGTQISVEVAMRLSARLLGTVQGDYLPIRASWRVRVIEALALAAITLGGGERELYAAPFGMLLTTGSQMLMYKDAKLRIALTARRLFSVEDMTILPLPAALHLLYPFLRPPLWLWRKATNYGAAH